MRKLLLPVVATMAATLGLVGTPSTALANDGFLGVETRVGRSPVTGEFGMLVTGIVPGSAADGFLLPGDVIMTVDDGSGPRRMTTFTILRNAIQTAGSGTPVTFDIHTPFGPWNGVTIALESNGGGVAYSLAPGAKAPVKQKRLKVMAKSARPGTSGTTNKPGSGTSSGTSGNGRPGTTVTPPRPGTSKVNPPRPGLRSGN